MFSLLKTRDVKEKDHEGFTEAVNTAEKFLQLEYKGTFKIIL